jgi:hypothetical protein
LTLAFKEIPYYLTVSIVDPTNSAATNAVPNSQMASHFCVSGCGHAAPTATRLLWGSDPHANRASWVKATGILYFERALNLIEMLMENNTFFLTPN